MLLCLINLIHLLGSLSPIFYMTEDKSKTKEYIFEISAFFPLKQKKNEPSTPKLSFHPLSKNLQILVNRGDIFVFYNPIYMLNIDRRTFL